MGNAVILPMLCRVMSWHSGFTTVVLRKEFIQMIPATQSTRVPPLGISSQEGLHLILSLLINHRVTSHISFFIAYTQSLLN